MTSSASPVTTAAGTSASRLRERSIERIVSSLGRATRWTSRPSRTGRAASSRACSITSPAIIDRRRLVGERPASVLLDPDRHRLVARSVECANTDAAEASETSCSPDRPPYSTPTRRRFTGVRIQEPKPEAHEPFGLQRSVTHTRRTRAPRRPRRRRTASCRRRRSCRSARAGRSRRSPTATSRDAGAEIILGNTYHLHLRPGDELDRARRRAARVHRLAASDPDRQRRLPGLQPGGDRGKVTEEGVEFRSHLDGALCALSPESATDIQARLGSDIAMVLDELVGPSRGRPDGTEVVPLGSDRGRRWSGRCGGRSGRVTRMLQLRARSCDRGGGAWSPTPARRSSASSRGAPTRRCGPKASRRRWRSASRPTRSAGLSVGEPVGRHV